MTKAEIVEEISRETGGSKKEIVAVIESFFEKVKDSMARGETMELRGFGTFGFKIRKARKARNPRTNQELHVPEHIVIHFKPGQELKELSGEIPVDKIKQEIDRKKRKPVG